MTYTYILIDNGWAWTVSVAWFFDQVTGVVKSKLAEPPIPFCPRKFEQAILRWVGLMAGLILAQVWENQAYPTQGAAAAFGDFLSFAMLASQAKSILENLGLILDPTAGKTGNLQPGWVSLLLVAISYWMKGLDPRLSQTVQVKEAVQNGKSAIEPARPAEPVMPPAGGAELRPQRSHEGDHDISTEG